MQNDQHYESWLAKQEAMGRRIDPALRPNYPQHPTTVGVRESDVLTARSGQEQLDIASMTIKPVRRV